jgi:hypothetical protein
MNLSLTRLSLLMLAPMALQAQAAQPVPAYGKLPLSFEVNQGQTDAAVQFVARAPQSTVFLAGADAVLEISHLPTQPTAVGGQSTQPPMITSAAVRMHLVGAQSAPQATPQERLPGAANYFTGNDPSKWRREVPLYARVRLEQVYPGIDVVYHGHQGQLENDFIIAPGRDPAAIRLGFDGAAPSLAANGDLVLKVNGTQDTVRFDRPLVYQLQNGMRHEIRSHYHIAANHQVSFRLGAYDRTRELIIDPTLLYDGVLGTGSLQTVANGMAVDAAGEIILTGITQDLTFPVTSGALQPVCTNLSAAAANNGYKRCGNYGASSGFVTKISADGTSLVYSTYLHGLSGYEYGSAVQINSAGDAVVMGATASNDFPITADAYQKLCQPYYTAPGTLSAVCDGFFNGGGTEYTVQGPNLFIVKLSPDGSTLLYSTFFGGSDGMTPIGLALDAEDNMYFTSNVDIRSAGGLSPNSGSVTIPLTASAYQSLGVDLNGATLSKLSADGHTLMYSTYLGTLNPHTYFATSGSQAIAAGKNGIVFLGGTTNAANFPTTPGVVRPACVASSGNAGNCVKATGFLSAFDTTKSGAASLLYSTFIGGTEVAGSNLPMQQVVGLAADASNNVYVTGNTYASDYPTTPGAYQTSCGYCATGFLTKLNPTGTAYVWSTYFGGTAANDTGSGGNAIALDSKGRVYLYGSGNDPTLPQVNPLQPNDGGNKTYVAAFSADGTQLLFSTLFGSGQSATTTAEYPAAQNGIAVDAGGNIYIAGSTDGGGPFVTTHGTYATTETGGYNRTFFAKLSPLVVPNAVASYSAGQVTLPLVGIGNAVYSDVVLTVAQIQSGPSGSTAELAGDIYNPATQQLTVPSVTLGAKTYYNVVVTVGSLVSIGGVSGADSFDGRDLTIGSVQLPDGTVHNDVVITVGKLIGVAGGMPSSTQDQFNATTGQLLIPAVEYQGHVYTNVTIVPGAIVSAGR